MRRYLSFPVFLCVIISASLDICAPDDVAPDDVAPDDIDRIQAVAVAVEKDPFDSPDLEPRFTGSLRIKLYHLNSIR